MKQSSRDMVDGARGGGGDAGDREGHFFFCIFAFYLNTVVLKGKCNRTLTPARFV
jgi:hypothetical protein